MASISQACVVDNGLSAYLEKVRRFPVLTREEEYELAQRYKNFNDLDAAHRLVTSHLRLVAKVASGYKGYGLPLIDVISEGTIGLMQAVKRFEPEKNFRLSTYAVWWIRAAIQEFILRSWSLVRIGTTRSQKRLFFNLRKIKNKIGMFEDRDFNVDQLSDISRDLDVKEKDVVEMNRRLLGRDASLNTPLGDAVNAGLELQDVLESEAPDQETCLLEKEKKTQASEVISQALHNLNERERDIFISRQLTEEPKTLEKLAEKFRISRERVRQIEAKAYEKVKIFLTNSDRL